MCLGCHEPKRCPKKTMAGSTPIPSSLSLSYSLRKAHESVAPEKHAGGLFVGVGREDDLRNPRCGVVPVHSFSFPFPEGRPKRCS